MGKESNILMLLKLLVLLFICITSYAGSPPPLGIQDEGGSISRPVNNLNCVGSGVACTFAANTGVITVSGGAVTMPLSFLTVTGASTLSSDVTIGAASTTYFTANPDLGVKGNISVDGSLYANGTGNVGIGVASPVVKLQVGSATLSRMAVGTKSMLVGGDLEIDGNIYTDGNFQAFGSGNFGINTISPAKTLEVNGDILVDTNLYVVGAKSTTGFKLLCIKSDGQIFSVSSASTCGGGT
jgi:hypothetical protein